MCTLKNNLLEWLPVVALILCSVHASVPHGSGGPPSTDGCISPCSRLLHSQERDSVGIRQKSIKVLDAQFVLCSLLNHVSMILFPASRCFLMLGLELQLDLLEFLWHLSSTQWFLNHQYCSGILWAQPFLLVLVVILFLSQPLCFEPELALLKLLLNPIALVAKICCWKIWFLQSLKLWYFFSWLIHMHLWGSS